MKILKSRDIFSVQTNKIIMTKRKKFANGELPLTTSGHEFSWENMKIIDLSVDDRWPWILLQRWNQFCSFLNVEKRTDSNESSIYRNLVRTRDFINWNRKKNEASIHNQNISVTVNDKRLRLITKPLNWINEKIKGDEQCADFCSFNQQNSFLFFSSLQLFSIHQQQQQSPMFQ